MIIPFALLSIVSFGREVNKSALYLHMTREPVRDFALLPVWPALIRHDDYRVMLLSELRAVSKEKVPNFITFIFHSY